MKPLVLLVLTLLLIFACGSQNESADSSSKVKSDRETGVVDTTVYSEDAETNAAIVQARKTLPEFYKRLEAPQDGDNGFSLKVKLTDENGEEECWFSQIAVEGDSLVGILSNKPVKVTSFKPGMKMAIEEKDIRDWMYFQNRKMVGNLTVYPMIKSLPPREAYLMKQSLGIE